MADSSDPRFVFPDEVHLTRMMCPECSGILAELKLPQISYYRCHVGHQYGPQSLAAAQAESAESKLWAAVAALEEQAASGRTCDRGARSGHGGGTPTGRQGGRGDRFIHRESVSHRHSRRIRQPAASVISEAVTGSGGARNLYFCDGNPLRATVRSLSRAAASALGLDARQRGQQRRFSRTADDLGAELLLEPEIGRSRPP
jgi:hypothetical protein